MSCKWRTRNQWNSWRSTSPVGHSPTCDSHKGSAGSLSSFSSFMREYLDRVIKADKCGQYVDDIGIATHSAEELKNNLREVFQCIREASLRLTMAKCQFGAKEVEFLGRTVSPEGIAPQPHKIKNYLQKLSFPKTKKGLQRYIVSLTIIGTTYLAFPKKSHHSTS